MAITNSTGTGLGMTSFRIPVENMLRLEAEFAKLNLKVARLRRKGYEAEDVSFVVTGQIREPQPEGAPDKIFSVVEVAGSTPRISGWTFVATLEHLDGGTVVRTVPTVPSFMLEAAQAYRAAGPGCDHCKSKRARIDTYVVVSDEGKAMQVGRRCLGDFLGGKSPETVASYAEILEQAGMAAESCCSGGGGGRQVAPLDQYLPYVVAAIRTCGWFSRTAVRDMPGKLATANVAWDFGLFPSHDLVKYAPESLLKCTEEDHARAGAVLSYVTSALGEREDLGDYEHNLRVVVRTGYVDSRTAGIAASLVSYYDRALGKLAERKVLAASRHVGVVGKRGELGRLVVLKVVDIDGAYGTSHLHVFRDAEGNVLKWFATAERLQVGNTYLVKGTVKKHEEYQGCRQTLVTRCQVAEIQEAGQEQMDLF